MHSETDHYVPENELDLADSTKKEPREQKERPTELAVHSYFDTERPEDIGQKVISAIEALPKPNQRKHLRAVVFRDLGLSENPTSEEIDRAFEPLIQSYQEKVREVKEGFPALFERIREWMHERGLVPKQQPEQVPVFVVDPILYLASHNGSRPRPSNHFASSHNLVQITPGFNLSMMAHEYFHAMSHDKKTGVTGFMESEGKKLRGNVWLNEGATMIGEFASFPTKHERKRDVPEAIYEQGYWWLTQRFLEEVGATEDELMKAYFGQEPERANLENKTHARFGCGIHDLNDLFFGSSEEAKAITEKIIRGEPVLLEARSGTGMDEKYERLANLFPHVTVTIKPGPDFIF